MDSLSRGNVLEPADSVVIPRTSRHWVYVGTMSGLRANADVVALPTRLVDIPTRSSVLSFDTQLYHVVETKRLMVCF